MKYKSLLFSCYLLAITPSKAYAQNLSNEVDERALFQQAYFHAKHILKETGKIDERKPSEAEVLPSYWQYFTPQILDYKKLTELITIFINFQKINHDLNNTTQHSIDIISEDLCSNAPCLACDYEYDPDHPKAEGPCTKGFCNSMWITPTSITSGFLFMFRTLSSFLWCGPCGVYISFGLGSCAGAAGGVCIACIPTCIKAVRKKLKEQSLKNQLEEIAPLKEENQDLLAGIGQCSNSEKAKLIADLQFLNGDQVMKLILDFYETEGHSQRDIY